MLSLQAFTFACHKYLPLCPILLAYLQTEGNMCVFFIDGSNQHDQQRSDNGMEMINSEEK
jgi:hypothetical protein